MNDLRKRLQDLAERIDALTLRERGLIFVGVLTVLYIVAMNLLFAPLRAEHKRVETAVRAKHQEVQALNSQLQVLIGSPDADAQQQGRITALQQEIRALDKSLEQTTGGMVSPQQMAKLLEQALARSHGVRLTKLENLPKALAVEQTVSANAASLGAVVYKHGVRIEVRGNYFELVEYLRKLEALPWKVFWGDVSLEVEKYPVSKLTVVVYTLSRHAGWIGA